MQSIISVKTEKEAPEFIPEAPQHTTLDYQSTRLVTGHGHEKPGFDRMTERFGHGSVSSVTARRACILCNLSRNPSFAISLIDAQVPLISQSVTKQDIISIGIDGDITSGLFRPDDVISLLTLRKVIRLAIAAHRPACPFLSFACWKTKQRVPLYPSTGWLVWLAGFDRLAGLLTLAAGQDRSGGLVGLQEAQP